jgi:hypothetical protein
VRTNQRATPFLGLVAISIAAVAIIQYGCSGSPTAPTASSSAVSGVVLDASSVAAGSLGQGTVTLAAAAATGGASISLLSSNPSVATVQATVMVPAGAMSAPFTVVAVAAGTATISASLNSSRQSSMLTVTGQSAGFRKSS